MRRFSTLASRGSPGFGVSFIGLARWAATRAGTSIRYRASTSRASASVVVSATVGPDAITERSSPGTSEMMSVTTRAGAAEMASLPPLIAERCLRTAFISSMRAPLLSNARVIACLSASVTSPPGSVSSADPPPEMSARTRSSLVRPCVIARISLAAAIPAASGFGCPASTTRIRVVGAPWPTRVTTSPSSGPRQCFSTAAAIAAAALPAPTTIVRPFGGLGKCSGTISAGSAAATAASNSERNRARRSGAVMAPRLPSPRGSARPPKPRPPEGRRSDGRDRRGSRP